MKKLLALVLAVLLLAACAPLPGPGDSPPPTAAPLPVEQTPAPTQVAVASPEDYLVEHMDAEENSAELFHYAFFTDDAKAVRCDVFVGGQSDPYASCIVLFDFEGDVTYALPAGTSRDCSTGIDGYEVGLQAIPLDAGYEHPRASILGCYEDRAYPSADVAAATRVLPDGASLDLGPFHCAVDAAVATCDYAAIGASISLGLSEIAVVN